MRLLFSTRPAYGHVYPLMPLANAARAAGHEVTFATTGAFVPKLEALGFPTLDAGMTIEHASEVLVRSLARDSMPKDDGGRPDFDMGGRMFIDLLARRTAADLAPMLVDVEPDVVVYEQFDLGAAVAAHAAGIPAVCHSLSPRMPDDVDPVGLRESARPAVGRARDVTGARSTCSPATCTSTSSRRRFSSRRSSPTRRGCAMRPIPFAEPTAVLPAWIACRASRPLVYLTLGTIVATDEVLRPAIEGLAMLDADILLALGSAAGSDIGEVPANVHVEPFVDQAKVVAHADLVVHHGGSGTLLGALAHGTPQLLLPKGADQFLNADAHGRTAGLATVLEPSRGDIGGCDHTRQGGARGTSTAGGRCRPPGDRRDATPRRCTRTAPRAGDLVDGTPPRAHPGVTPRTVVTTVGG